MFITLYGSPLPPFSPPLLPGNKMMGSNNLVRDDLKLPLIF